MYQLVISTTEKNEADRGQKRAGRAGQRAILSTRLIREVLTERGNLKEVRNQAVWLSGGEHCSRGIRKGKDPEVSAWLAS